MAQIKHEQTQEDSKLVGSLKDRIKKLKAALSSDEIDNVANAIYDHKTSELVNPIEEQKIQTPQVTALKKEMDSLVTIAEQRLFDRK